MALSFMALGMSASLVGPTFVHLTYMLETDIQTLSVSYTTGSIGYLLGAAVCGLTADKVNSELQFVVSTASIGMAVIVCPWAPTVYLYYAIDATKAFFMGYLDACGQSYIIYLWSGHSLKDPMMNLMHGIWSVGATLAPFMIAPLLPELPDENSDDTQTDIANSTTATPYPYDNETVTNYDDVTSGEFEGAMSIRLCYAIIGGLVFSMSLFFGAAYIRLGPSCIKPPHSKPRPESEEHIANTRTFITVILCLQFVFYAAYNWLEILPGGYIATLVIKGLDWDVRQGSLITSLFWGSHGVGRIVAVPISYFVSPAVLTALDLVGTTAGFTLMWVALVTAQDALLWISVALIGFSIASIFASMILWTSNHMTVTGFVGAVFLVASSFGGMIGGALAGALFQQYTHLWVIYLGLIACIIEILIYIALLMFVRVYKSNGDKRKCKDKPEVESHLMTTQ